jgi:GT2 family glycosyltransferase
MKDLSIVVVTYKEEMELLKNCFDSVKESEGLSFELIVTDNGGREDTKELVESYAGAAYIRNTENRGFAYAVNQGMKQGRGRYILLLNPDTHFEPDVLARMVKHLIKNPKVGVASSLILHPDGEIQKSIRRFPGFWNQLLIMLKVPHIFPKNRSIGRYMMNDKDPKQTQDVESIMGAFMFIRRELIEEIGLFDERYFIWFEEVDYCKMAYDAGWKIRHYADVDITHLKGHMFGKIATLKKQKWMRTSMRKYMRKHKGVLAWGAMWMLTPLFIALAHIISIIKPK